MYAIVYRNHVIVVIDIHPHNVVLMSMQIWLNDTHAESRSVIITASIARVTAILQS